MIDVLLATHEGERYLDEQVQSILAQENADLRILARDDGSTDGTYFLLHAYETTQPGRFSVVEGPPAGGAAENFFLLLENSEAPYVMLCDQDDVWYPYKAEKTLDVMQRLEREHGRDCPILVHSDLAVLADGQIVAGSLMHYQMLDPARTAPRQLICQNVVTGCTVMANRALIELVLSRPHAGALMHDWWLALAASVFGEIGYVPESTMLYRQHGDNRVGAKNARSAAYLWRRARDGETSRDGLVDTCRQAAGFLAAFGDLMEEDERALFAGYARIPEEKKPARIRALFRLGAWKHGLLRKLGQIRYV